MEVIITHGSCIRCWACVGVCDYKALKKDNNKVKVEQNKCVGCYTCIAVCPTQSIQIK